LTEKLETSKKNEKIIERQLVKLEEENKIGGNIGHGGGLTYDSLFARN